MTGAEFQDALRKLSFAQGNAPNDLGQSAFARFVGVRTRAVADWTVKGPPGPIITLLRLMLAAKISAERARKLLEG